MTTSTEASVSHSVEAGNDEEVRHELSGAVFGDFANMEMRPWHVIFILSKA
jgi:hypothetical protein